MMELRIDREFESKIPPLTAEEFRQLEENILADGVVINPIIVWNGVIVDGHNRYRIIEQNPGIQYTTHEKRFDDRYAVIAWICKNQLGRRNLTPEQKKYLIGKQYEAEKATQGGNHGNQHTSAAKCQVGTLASADTADRIAKENGIGRRSVFRAEAFSKAVDIADEVDPGIRYDLLSGKIKTNDKEISELVDATPTDRTALVGELRKPPQERRKVLPERTILTTAQIASQPLADIGNTTPDFMFGELDAAMESFMFRWSVCLSQYKVYFASEEHRPSVCQRARDGVEYLNRILQGDIPLGTEDVEQDNRELVTADPIDRPVLINNSRQPPTKKRDKCNNPETELIQKIADDMLVERSNGRPSTMIYEMNDALESMIYRWEFCEANHADFFELGECLSEIEKLIRNGQEFLQAFEARYRK